MADRFDLINFGKSVVTTTGGTSANVNIDANTLFIDGTNNRVGIGTATPLASIDVVGSDRKRIRATGAAEEGILLFQNGTTGTSTTNGFLVGIGGDSLAYLLNYHNSPMVFSTNGGERMRIAANGNIGIGNATPAHALSIAGALRTTSLSTNYAISDAVASTVATGTPTAVCSVTITTLGKPVLLLAAGDSNPNQAGGWHYYQFYRDNTAIGKRYINENSGGASTNDPWSTIFIDAPAAGTYSYQLRVWQGSGSFTYGEDGNFQAPTIIAMEMI